MKVISYPCIQSDSVDVGPNFPSNAPPPQWVIDRIQNTMHKNGLTCYSMVGGTDTQRQEAANAILASQPVTMPNNWSNSCTATDYFTGYQVTPVYGATAYDTTHYSVSSTCLHKFYYNQQYSPNGTIQWDWTWNCGAVHTSQCTPHEEFDTSQNGSYLINSPIAYFDRDLGGYQTNSIDQSWQAFDTYKYNGAVIGPAITGFTTN